MNAFILAALSLISLLMIASGVYILSKKVKLPYTVLLVGVGIMLAFASQLSFLSFIDDFKLTPEILLYVFLPVLLFESAYNIKYKELLRNIRAISLLAVLALVISAFVIAFAFQFILWLAGIHIPFLIALLFGSLISATDPVAVLALFKELGAPRRLTLIFEGESLFNDGTALALFIVILGYIVSQSTGVIPESISVFENIFMTLQHALVWDISLLKGFVSFFLMIFLGIVFGGVIGIIFSKIIGRLKNQEFLEISLTLVLAHTTFILSEVINHSLIPVSGVIATTIAWMVVGNYGRYKISPKVEETMGHFWEFFAFIANSLVFLLIGIMIVGLKIDWVHLGFPVVVSIIVVMVARAISIYSVIGALNWTKLEEVIPASWQHLLSWGSLRWALAIIMVLLIPDDLTVSGWNLPYSVKDFVLGVTVGCIVFTTFIKATTITPLMRKFGIDRLHEIEEVEYVEGRMIMLIEVMSKIERIHTKSYISDEEKDILMAQYRKELAEVHEKLQVLIMTKKDSIGSLIERVASLHALGIEKFWLRKLYKYNEISERVFKILIHKIENQIYRIESGKTQLKGVAEEDRDDVLLRLTRWISEKLNHDENPVLTKYMKLRVRQITADKALKWLLVLQGVDFVAWKNEFREVVKRYENFKVNARMEKEKIFQEHKDMILAYDSYLVTKSLLKTEEEIVDDLFAKEIISPKLYIFFKNEIENSI